MKTHLFLMILLMLLFCSCTSNIKEFYVSPTGNDNNPGTKGQPFLSFNRTKEAVSQIIANGTKNKEIQVYFRGGTYFFDQSVVIKSEEFGLGNNKIIFSSYQDEKPVFSSGKILTGWNKLLDNPPFLPEIAKGKVWVTKIPESESRPIARFLCNEDPLPNAVSKGLFTDENDSVRKSENDFYYYKSPEAYSSFIFPKKSLREWENLNDIEIITRPHYGWVLNILPLRAIDIKKNIAYTTIPGTYKICRLSGSESPYFNIWVQNAIDYLDEPGEWVINSVEGKIYYWPKGGEPSNVFYPLLKELIKVEGNRKDNCILKNIVFRGITFAHGDRDTWDHDAIGLQHDWALYNESDALLRFINTADCIVDNCTFKTSGGGGIRFDFYSQNNKVINCEFNNLGGTAILFAGYGPGLKDVNKNNEIINNKIHNCGQIYLDSPGIFIWQSGRNRIAHNLIYNMPYDGIVISGPRPLFFSRQMGNKRELTGTIHYDEIEDGVGEDWDKLFPYLFSGDNIIEYNELHDNVQKIDDGDPIYLSGTGYNNIVRKNYVHDNISSCRHGEIRADDQAKGTTISENIIYKFTGEGIAIKHPNYVKNNFIVDWIPSEKKPSWEISMNDRYIVIVPYGPIKGSIIKKNIFYQSAGLSVPFLEADFSASEISGLSESPKLSDCAIDSNIYFATGVYHNCLDQLGELRKQGVDSNSVVADPCFEGLEEAGFKLKNNSPAIKLGIKQIDFENIGLLKSKMRL